MTNSKDSEAGTGIDSDRLIAMLPQKEPMVFVDNVTAIDYENKKVCCSFKIGGRKCVALEEDGSMAAVSLVENIAQTVAIIITAESLRKHEDFKIGLILSIRKLEFFLSGHLSYGTDVRTEAVISFADDNGVMMAEGTAYNALTCEKIISARLTLLKPSDEKIAELLNNQ